MGGTATQHATSPPSVRCHSTTAQQHAPCAPVAVFHLNSAATLCLPRRTAPPHPLPNALTTHTHTHARAHTGARLLYGVADGPKVAERYFQHGVSRSALSLLPCRPLGVLL